MRHEHTLEKLFAPLQFGVSVKSGCEKVVHRLHDHFLAGNAILSIDLANAFNSPPRSEIAKAVFGLHTLRPFHRLFHAEYSEASELLFYGRDGHYHGSVESTAGVRQGSPLSTLFFCAFLQPILETIASEFQTLNYLLMWDDINWSQKIRIPFFFFFFFPRVISWRHFSCEIL